MNPKDESILSAFLDDELPPDDHSSVAWTIAADPDLSDRLGGLANIRAAVKSLSRPTAPCNLSSTVLARIAAEPKSSRRPYLWIATAASLIFAVGLWIRSDKVDLRDRLTVVADIPAPSKNAEIVRTGPASVPVVNVEATIPLGPLDEPNSGARHAVSEILERPGVRRILIQTDVIDPSAGDRVNALVREVSRKNADYGRINITQGITVDRNHPDRAEVFALVMDEREQEQLLGSLRKEFPDAVTVETETNPTVVTQLGQIGDVVIGTGRSAAGLGEPPPGVSLVAIRHPGFKANDIDDGNDPFRFFDPDQPASPLVGSLELAGISTVSLFAQEPLTHLRPKRSNVTKPVPVLVWVTSKRVG